MFQFEIDGDGHVREAEVHEAVARLKELFPELDAAALEATMMLERTHSIMVDVRAPYWTEFGITGRRFILLRLLYLAPERRLSMGEIAAKLNAGTPNVTQLIDGLVRDELVRRSAAEGDKRVIYAVLTDKGTQVFESVFQRNAVRMKESWTPLTDREKYQLVHLLARLRIHLLAAGAGEEGADASSFAAALPEEPPEPARTRRRRG